jgi:NAD-dependent dihydropyrimidine dehydrogenase PreA subunit
VAFLAVGAFVARPYCRYMCPYGVLLGLLSRVAWRSAEITPRTCVRCRLCERVCPVDAIEPPETPPEDVALRAKARRRLVWALGLTLPVVLAGAALGRAWSPRLARLHPDVARASLASRAAQGERFTDAESVDALDAIEAEGATLTELDALADTARSRLATLAPWIGGVLAVGAMLRLIHLLRFRRSAAYDIEPADCVACGRCFVACPLNRPRVAAESPAPETGEP